MMSEGERTVAPALRRRVLVVDDDPRSRLVLADVCRAEGWDVVEAENGAQALELAAAGGVDVALLDVQMPVLDGCETCRRLKAAPATAPIPVLMVTGLAERADRLKAIAAGANDYLNKPIDTEDVVLRVRNALHMKHLHDELQEKYDELRHMAELRARLTRMLQDDNATLSAVFGFLAARGAGPAPGDASRAAAGQGAG
jgi:CheY-like chemotaxis protein